MKTISFVTIVCALSLGSCIRDDAILGEREPEPEPEALRFSVSTIGGFSLATRAPINSAEAVQSIADVRIHAFRTYDGGGTFRYIKSFNISANWSQGTTSATYAVPRAEMVDPGNYRFLAVGLDSPSDYTLPTLTPSLTLYSTVAATLATAPAAAQEIFSGYSFHAITAGAESVSITMTRRVAGVLLYVSNVPAQVNGQQATFLRLAISRSNTSVDITSLPDDNIEPAAASQAGYNIFNINLSAQGDANSDGIWDGSPPVAGVAKLPNTTLAGAYILPAVFTTGATMTLSLVGADGVAVLRSWTVLDQTNSATFNVRANSLYALGRKLQSGNTNNGTPADPDDDDAPIDLSRSQSLTSTVDDVWGNIHTMSIENNP
jgi:hypothetical protein